LKVVKQLRKQWINQEKAVTKNFFYGGRLQSHKKSRWDLKCKIPTTKKTYNIIHLYSSPSKYIDAHGNRLCRTWRPPGLLFGSLFLVFLKLLWTLVFRGKNVVQKKKRAFLKNCAWKGINKIISVTTKRILTMFDIFVILRLI
jgi:hypothetical protein